MPYLDQGEFYSEFGNWEVSITLPDNYSRRGIRRLAGYIRITTSERYRKTKAIVSEKLQVIPAAFERRGKKGKTAPEMLMPASSKNLKTLTYILNNAHDFAWFASKLFLVHFDTLQINDRPIDVFSYYNPWDEEYWRNSVKYMKDAVRFYSKKIGEYPYNTVSAVAGNAAVNSGGMEYPTITLITMTGSQAGPGRNTGS
jgi:hypothetical protein